MLDRTENNEMAGFEYDDRWLDAWFKWVNWSILTGVLYGGGKATGSWLLIGLSVVSVLILGLWTWLRVERFLADRIPRFEEDTTSKKALAWGLTIVFTVLPFFIAFVIGDVFQMFVDGARSN